MKHFWLVFLFVLFCGLSFAQPCPENIGFATQNDIDNFSTNHPDCTEIEGNVTIGGFLGNGTGLMTDLNGLSQITTIGGYLSVSGVWHLPSLSGLENIQSVGGSLFIDGNIELQDIDALSNLESVGGSIYIAANLKLQNINALSNLESVGGQHITILSNSILEDLKAFEQIDFQLERVWISGNSALTNLDGLQGIESVEVIKIEQNAGLTSLEGLDNLKSVDSLLVISNNDALIDIAALNIDTIGQLRIFDNDTLTSLEGLNDTYFSSTNEIMLIRKNDLLSVCNIPSICNYIENGGDTRIEDNADGCNSVEEVTALCLVSNDTVEFDDDISIFPNPNTGLFSIKGVSKGSYTIHNTAGQLIQKGELTNDMFINISSEQSGIYFISMTINDKFVKRRILKM